MSVRNSREIHSVWFPTEFRKICLISDNRLLTTLMAWYYTLTCINMYFGQFAWSLSWSSGPRPERYVDGWRDRTNWLRTFARPSVPAHPFRSASSLRYFGNTSVSPASSVSPTFRVGTAWVPNRPRVCVITCVSCVSCDVCLSTRWLSLPTTNPINLVYNFWFCEMGTSL